MDMTLNKSLSSAKAIPNNPSNSDIFKISNTKNFTVWNYSYMAEYKTLGPSTSGVNYRLFDTSATTLQAAP
jgi:hypothetical protein